MISAEKKAVSETLVRHPPQDIETKENNQPKNEVKEEQAVKEFK